ncbi:histone acetylase complex subunit MRG15-2 [Talaromyces proteolyticus]|uniref:Chromatin modification-related protein EAF3 n=1 Tax=Talaromyces proteolyticus TaxID=1131652 RepID=A0AAD4KRJ3_9EURO|nr:histone acetylase complex subunit MRG15-2 [Talaromyces proteolyticus]KAH8697685.1 histone acetylase complex subunit MRG15-2 [Talaromyces proteolyticus]
MAPATTNYSRDERVLCFHHEVLYEAKIMDLKHTVPDDRKSPYEYLVHYKGWKNTALVLPSTPFLPLALYLNGCRHGSGRQRFSTGGKKLGHALTSIIHSWDDWVPQERLRKFTEENRELAAQIRREISAQSWAKANPNSKLTKRRGGSDSGRGSEERQSSVPAKGNKRGRDNEIEKEDQFHSRPSIRIMLPDNLKALLVDDWENVTKNQQVVALPAPHSVNSILQAYSDEENPKRSTTAETDVLEEVTMGIKEYFDKSLDKILLYKFEREQYRILRQKWESGADNYADKGPLDIYGAHHLVRLFAVLPELIAQTNMDQQSINRLREELSKFTIWLSRNTEQFFSNKYISASAEYMEKATGVPLPNPGTATSRLV